MKDNLLQNRHYTLILDSCPSTDPMNHAGSPTPRIGTSEGLTINGHDDIN